MSSRADIVYNPQSKYLPSLCELFPDEYLPPVFQPPVHPPRVEVRPLQVPTSPKPSQDFPCQDQGSVSSASRISSRSPHFVSHALHRCSSALDGVKGVHLNETSGQIPSSLRNHSPVQILSQPSTRHITSHHPPAPTQAPSYSFAVLRSDPQTSSLQQVASGTDLHDLVPAQVTHVTDSHSSSGALLDGVSMSFMKAAPSFRVTAQPPPVPLSQTHDRGRMKKYKMLVEVDEKPRTFAAVHFDVEGKPSAERIVHRRSINHTESHRDSLEPPPTYTYTFDLSISSCPTRPLLGSGDMDVEEDDNGDGREGKGTKLGKKHTCKICDKRFNRPSSLRIHQTTHTGIKPYKCKWSGCGRLFNVNSNMRRHFRNHVSTARATRVSMASALGPIVLRPLPEYDGNAEGESDSAGDEGMDGNEGSEIDEDEDSDMEVSRVKSFSISAERSSSSSSSSRSSDYPPPPPWHPKNTVSRKHVHDKDSRGNHTYTYSTSSAETESRSHSYSHIRDTRSPSPSASSSSQVTPDHHHHPTVTNYAGSYKKTMFDCNLDDRISTELRPAFPTRSD